MIWFSSNICKCNVLNIWYGTWTFSIVLKEKKKTISQNRSWLIAIKIIIFFFFCFFRLNVMFNVILQHFNVRCMNNVFTQRRWVFFSIVMPLILYHYNGKYMYILHTIIYRIFVCRIFIENTCRNTYTVKNIPVRVKSN